MTASITVVLDDLLSVSGVGSATSIEVTLTQDGPAGVAGPVGGTITAIAGTALGGQRVVTITNGEANYASADDLDHLPTLLAVTTGAAILDDTVTAIHSGTLSDVSFNWTLGLPIFLGLNGLLTQTLPPTAVFSLIVGYPTTVTSLYVSLRDPIIL